MTIIKFRIADIRENQNSVTFVNEFDGCEYKVTPKKVPSLKKTGIAVGSMFLANVSRGYLNDIIFRGVIVPFVVAHIEIQPDGSAILYNALAKTQDAAAHYVAPDKVELYQKLGVNIDVPMMVSLSCITTAPFPAITNVYAVGEPFVTTQKGNPIGYMAGYAFKPEGKTAQNGKRYVRAAVNIARKDEPADWVSVNMYGRDGENLLACANATQQSPYALFDIGANGTKRMGQTRPFVTYSANHCTI